MFLMGYYLLFSLAVLLLDCMRRVSRWTVLLALGGLCTDLVLVFLRSLTDPQQDALILDLRGMDLTKYFFYRRSGTPHFGGRVRPNSPNSSSELLGFWILPKCSTDLLGFCTLGLQWGNSGDA